MKNSKELDPYILKRIHSAMEMICEIMEVDVAVARGPLRRLKYHWPRCIVAKTMSHEGMRLREIGQYLGNRDHSTVINMIYAHGKYMVSNDEKSLNYKRFYQIFQEVWSMKPPMREMDGMDIARCRARKVSPYIFPGMRFGQKKASV